MSIYAQNFNALNDGDLNGQDSWSGEVAFDVETSVKYEGVKAIACLGIVGSWTEIIRTISTTTDNGSLSIAMNINRGAAGETVMRTLLYNTTPAEIINIYFQHTSAGTVRAFLNDTQVFTGLSASTWYLFNIEFNFATDQCRVQVNGGAFSNWINFYAASTGITKISFKHYSENAGSACYWDALDISLPVVGPANLKSYNTNLSANIKSINTNLIANVKSLNTNV